MQCKLVSCWCLKIGDQRRSIRLMAREGLYICFFLHNGVVRGLVTDPMATAPAIANPRAADLPRPRAAVIVTVILNVFSAIASMNFTTAFDCTPSKQINEWVSKSKRCIYSRSLWETHLRAAERHLPYGITQCYLPHDTGKPTPAKQASTRYRFNNGKIPPDYTTLTYTTQFIQNAHY